MDRYYHLVNRVVHRAFYLDEYEPWHEVTPPLPLHQWGLTLWSPLPPRVGGREKGKVRNAETELTGKNRIIYVQQPKKGRKP